MRNRSKTVIGAQEICGYEIRDRGIANNLTASIGEILSKNARHMLTRICIQGITEDLKAKPLANNKQPGRPRTPEADLADQLGVTQKTVHRWIDPEAIQAADENTVKICEIAFTYDPIHTEEILKEDLTRSSEIIDSWLLLHNPQL